MRWSVEGVGDQRCDGAKSQRREVQHAGGQDLWHLVSGRRERLAVAHGGAGVGAQQGRYQRADHLEILEAAASLVELESRLLWGGGGLGDWRRRKWVLGRRCGRRYVLRGSLGGAGQHLDHLLEGGGISLDEGGGVRIGIGRS